jgi:hypothetical protein
MCPYRVETHEHFVCRITGLTSPLDLDVSAVMWSGTHHVKREVYRKMGEGTMSMMDGDVESSKNAERTKEWIECFYSIWKNLTVSKARQEADHKRRLINLRLLDKTFKRYVIDARSKQHPIVFDTACSIVLHYRNRSCQQTYVLSKERVKKLERAARYLWTVFHPYRDKAKKRYYMEYHILAFLYAKMDGLTEKGYVYMKSEPDLKAVLPSVQDLGEFGFHNRTYTRHNGVFARFYYMHVHECVMDTTRR